MTDRDGLRSGYKMSAIGEGHVTTFQCPMASVSCVLSVSVRLVLDNSHFNLSRVWRRSLEFSQKRGLSQLSALFISVEDF